MNIMINNKKQKEKNCIPTLNFKMFKSWKIYINKCNDNDTIQYRLKVLCTILRHGAVVAKLYCPLSYFIT